ncbi:hypothetical protein Tco_1189804, partial [Tanacetum coccineum]
MVPTTTPLLGFSGEISWPLGQISLMVTLGDEEHSENSLMNFMVVRSPSLYNGIIGRPGLRKIQAVPSTAHEMLKFPVKGVIVTIRSKTIIPAECRMVTKAHDVCPPKEPAVTDGVKVAIHREYPDQTVMIGGSLSEKGRMELCNLLKENLDVFAWKPADMTGVPCFIAEHRLNIREGCQPIRQKRRGQTPDRNKAIQEEVAKLVEAEIMREVHYHDWISNPVMVKKHDGSWRICVDFTDLNKSCPKSPFQKSTGKLNLSMDTLSSASWTLTRDTTKYRLRNRTKKKWLSTPTKESSATQKCRSASRTLEQLTSGSWIRKLKKQIDRNLEVYVDDLVIKSHTEGGILRDIEDTFHNLRRINMKLNRKKCTFGAKEGAFLGHVVSMKGIKACPEKVEAVMKLQSPQTLK